MFIFVASDECATVLWKRNPWDVGLDAPETIEGLSSTAEGGYIVKACNGLFAVDQSFSAWRRIRPFDVLP